MYWWRPWHVKSLLWAFNISSNPEIIAENETGYLIEDLNIEAFTLKVETLIEDPALRDSFGQPEE